MTPSFSAVDRGDQWPGIADDQPAAARLSILSTWRDKSSSSSISPAYGSSSGSLPSSSATSAETEVRLRFASRSSRFAAAGGSEIVLRTEDMQHSMNQIV